MPHIKNIELIISKYCSCEIEAEDYHVSLNNAYCSVKLVEVAPDENLNGDGWYAWKVDYPRFYISEMWFEDRCMN